MWETLPHKPQEDHPHKQTVLSIFSMPPFTVYFVCLEQTILRTLIGERNTLLNRGCFFLFTCGPTYVILYFDPVYFGVRPVFDPVPNFSK